MSEDTREFEEMLKKAFQEYYGDRPRIDFARSDDCPNPETFAAFCAGELHGADRDRVLEHIAKCPGCLSDVAFCLKETVPLDIEETLEEIEMFVNGQKREISVHWLLPGYRAKVFDVKEAGDYEVRCGDRSLSFRCDEEDLFTGREELKDYKKVADSEGKEKLKTISGDQISVTIHRGKIRRNRPPSGAVFEITIRRES